MSQQKSIIVWSSEQSRAQKNINKKVLQSEHRVCGWLLWPCHSLVFLQQASWKADANLCHCSENWCWKGSLLILSVVRETQRSWECYLHQTTFFGLGDVSSTSPEIDTALKMVFLSLLKEKEKRGWAADVDFQFFQ